MILIPVFHYGVAVATGEMVYSPFGKNAHIRKIHNSYASVVVQTLQSKAGLLNSAAIATIAVQIVAAIKYHGCFPMF